jgi:N-acetylglucosamine-6-phosphate deacetylase
MIIKNGRVYNSNFKFENTDVRTEGDIISELSAVSGDTSSQELIDASGCIVIPGFVDIHTHGAYGNDFTNIDTCDVDQISTFYASHGVSNFLATTMTDTKEKLLRVLRTLADIPKEALHGAKMAGIHLEGPFISPKACGAQPPECVQQPSPENFRIYFDAAKGKIKLVTLAPEIEGSAEMVKYAASLGVVCSCGHTKATYQQAADGINAGISHATHFFNAMTGFHHREPGVVGAFFDAEDTRVEFISDLIHLNACVLRTVYKVKGADNIIGITDSMEATGLKNGKYKLGLQNVITKDGVATLEDGTLAGSTLTMDLALKNLAQKVKIPLEDAVKMLTYNPAKEIGMKDIGLLKPGNKADITILDSQLNVKYTIIDGKVLYKA